MGGTWRNKTAIFFYPIVGQVIGKFGHAIEGVINKSMVNRINIQDENDVGLYYIKRSYCWSLSICIVYYYKWVKLTLLIMATTIWMITWVYTTTHFVTYVFVNTKTTTSFGHTIKVISLRFLKNIKIINSETCVCLGYPF